MDRVKKRLAYLLAMVLLLALLAPAAPAVMAFAATKNPITELGVKKLPEGNTIKVGEVFNFDPDIIATERGKGKSTGVVWWEINAKTNTAGVSSSRWGYVYPVYAGSFEIRALAFANTKDLNAWKAARKANGYVAEEAVTASYATAMTDWVKIDVVSDMEGYAVARSQYQLGLALKNRKVKEIHIQTDKSICFTIGRKSYVQRTLVVDAPNAEVENAGHFAQINIKQIKASTFTEKAYGNRFHVTAPDARIVFVGNARTNEVVFEPGETAETNRLTLVGEGGMLSELDVKAAGNVDIVGSIFADRAGKAVVVNVAEEAAGTSIQTDAALEVNAAADVAVTVNKAEEGETVQGKRKTVINMEKAVKVSVDGTAADGTTVVVKDGAKGAEIASDAALVIVANADVTLNLTENAAGTTVTKGENVKVNLSAESKVDGVSITDVNGTVETIKPGEDSPEVTAAPSATPVPTTAPSGGSSGGWTPSYPVTPSTPAPTAVPTSGASYTLDGKSVGVSFASGSKEAVVALPADSLSKTVTLTVNGNSVQKALVVGVNAVSIGEYTVKFIVPVESVKISASLSDVKISTVSGSAVTGSAILVVKVKDDLSAFTADPDFTVSYEWKIGDTVTPDISGTVYQKAVEVAVNGNLITYAEAGAYSVVVKVNHSKAGETLTMKSGSLKIDFRMQEGEEPEITPTPIPTPDPGATPTPDPGNTPTPDDKPENDHVMDWKDAALEAAMRKITGIYDRGIMLSDVYNLTELFMQGISNIEALAELPHLRNLFLVNTNISDISALEGMAELESLEVSRSKLSDIGVLKTLPNLRVVNIADNNITDISVLKEIKNLQHFVISGNPVSLQDVLGVLSGRTGLTGLGVGGFGITDIKVLTDAVDLTGLTYLDLSSNSISNLEALAQMLNLTRLMLSDCGITDITVLSGMTKLVSLDLSNNQVSSIDALAGLANLEYLYLSGNQITDIAALSDMTKLVNLHLMGNQVSSIDALAGLVNLEYLYLSDNQITNINALSGMTKLTRLELLSNQVSSIGALAGLVNLEDLSLSGDQITDITALSGMTKLTRLYLPDIQTGNIDALAGLVNLETLDLPGNHITNQITDITALSGLTKLTRLDLLNHQVSNIDVLAELVNLVELDLSGNQITDITALSGLVNLKTLYLYGNQITDYTPVEFVPNVYK